MASATWNGQSITNMAATKARILHIERERKFPRDEFSYVIKVTWSYGCKTLTKRKYQDFQRLQRRLLDEYRDVNRATRIIPNLLDTGRFELNARKAADGRITELNDYLNRLIHLPKEMSQSNTVLDFLEPEIVGDVNRKQIELGECHSLVSGNRSGNSSTDNSPPAEPWLSVEKLAQDNAAFDPNCKSDSDSDLSSASFKLATDDAVFSPCDVGDVIHVKMTSPAAATYNQGKDVIVLSHGEFELLNSADYFVGAGPNSARKPLDHN